MIHDMHFEIKQVSEDMCCRDDKVLRYTLQYPLVYSHVFRQIAFAMNRHYNGRMAMWRQQLRQSLYHQAVRAHEQASHSGVPFRPFEAAYMCVLAFNQDCTVSLYFDVYRYTGGEAGQTIRSSDTWDLPCGRRVTMAWFFAPSAIYKTDAVRAVTTQIATQSKDGGAYFDDYEERAMRYFNINNFYIVPEGLMVYYQQNQLAPYAAGLPQFLLPFSDEVLRPRCR